MVGRWFGTVLVVRLNFCQKDAFEPNVKSQLIQFYHLTTVTIQNLRSQHRVGSGAVIAVAALAASAALAVIGAVIVIVVASFRVPYANIYRHRIAGRVLTMTTTIKTTMVMKAKR